MPPHEPLQPAEPVDLTQCDREPIHVPGSIQPHGVLLAVTEPDLRVAQASANTQALLGVAHGEVLGALLPALVDEDGLAGLHAARDLTKLRWVAAFPVGIRGHAFRGIVHRSGGLLVLELEPPDPPGGDGATGDLYDQAREAIDRILSARGLADLWHALASLVRRITGFDRVMVYRFAEDGSGEVVAEEKRDDLEPYLGLHYPASDIPQQARRLYVLNRLRLIRDAAYVPVPILPADNPLTGAPLDLGGSVLRSVSPFHRAYLSNMGVRASMSTSLVEDERLRGLIACHHLEPKLVPYRARMLCEILGDVVSWTLAPRLMAAETDARVRAGVVRARLVEAMATGPDLAAALVGGTPSALDLVEARGFAFSCEGRVVTAGETPQPDQIAALVGWLRGAAEGAVYATDALPAAYPPAAAFAGTASGLLAAIVSSAQALYLLWFRPEAAREVSWGGDPRRPAEVEGGHLSPRRSFALWKETVRGRSQPWAPWAVDAAAELRDAAATVLLQRTMAEAFELNVDLQRALASRDDFLSMASHELRTPTTTLRLQIASLRRLCERGPLAPAEAVPRLDKADRQVDRLALLIGHLLDVSRIAAGRLDLERTRFDLADLAREVVERFDEHGVAVHVEATGDTEGAWDRFRLDQVLTNLLTNAVKYGEGRPVSVVVRGDGDRVVCSVEDRGIGIPPEALPRLFARFERAVSPGAFEGVGLGLWIVAQIVERHGGRITVESAPGRGSTFTVGLPRSGASGGERAGGEEGFSSAPR